MTVSKCIPLKQSFFSCSIGRDVGGATFDGRESCFSSARRRAKSRSQNRVGRSKVCQQRSQSVETGPTCSKIR